MELFYYIVIGFFVFVAIVIGSIFRLAKKRREDLKNAAHRYGFSYMSSDPSIFAMLPRFDIFSKGHSRTVSNILRGELNKIKWTIFDYRYIVGGGKSSSTHLQTVIITQLDSNLPRFTIGPESFFHRIGDVFGYKDIDFIDNPDFSKKYLLKGPDEPSIRELFTPEVLRFFESRERGINVETDDNNIIIYNYGKLISPKNLYSFINEATRIVNLFGSKKF